MMRTLTAAALVTALPLAASADWTQAQRARFVGQCVQSCQATPNLPEARRQTCSEACGCTADTAETVVTPADMYAIDEAVRAGQTTETMNRIRSYFASCVRRALRRDNRP
jgi:hypothetical protein